MSKTLGRSQPLIDLRQHLLTGLVLVLGMDPAENLGNTSLEQFCFGIIRVTRLDFFESRSRTVVVAVQILGATNESADHGRFCFVPRIQG